MDIFGSHRKFSKNYLILIHYRLILWLNNNISITLLTDVLACLAITSGITCNKISIKTLGNKLNVSCNDNTDQWLVPKNVGHAKMHHY